MAPENAACPCPDPLREVHPGCPLHGHSPEAFEPDDVIVTAFVKCPECGQDFLAMADEEVTGCAQHGS